MRETRSKNTFPVLLLFEPALPLGIEHSLGQPGTSLFYSFTTCSEKCTDSNGEGPRWIGAAVAELYEFEVLQ